MYEKVTVAQFCHLAIEDSENVQIWDVEAEKTVFDGTFREAE